jgi:hypothetical protein
MAVAAHPEHLEDGTVEVARISSAQRRPGRVHLLERDALRHEASLDLHEDGRPAEHDEALVHGRIVP